MFERIRRDGRDEGLSIRALAERYEVHRRTVRQALADATPPERKVPVRAWPVLGAHEAQIRAWLVEDLLAPRKQRHTARRVWQRLRDEHGAQLGESTVRGLVGQIRQEIAATNRLVPTGRVRYDNLKPAVIRVLLGRERMENERFIALRSHYLLTELLAVFSQVNPGVSLPAGAAGCC